MGVTKKQIMDRLVAVVAVLLIALSIVLSVTTDLVTFAIGAGFIAMVFVIIILYAVMNI